jgi:hypothetical protein
MDDIIILLTKSGKVRVTDSVEQAREPADAQLIGSGGARKCQDYEWSARSSSSVLLGNSASGSAGPVTRWSANCRVKLVGRNGQILWAGNGFSEHIHKSQPVAQSAAEDVVKQLLKALKTGKW